MHSWYYPLTHFILSTFEFVFLRLFPIPTGPLEEGFIAYIMRELLLALKYLHSERKIHRDVKAGNLLVASDGALKLADFGVTGEWCKFVELCRV